MADSLRDLLGTNEEIRAREAHAREHAKRDDPEEIAERLRRIDAAQASVPACAESDDRRSYAASSGPSQSSAHSRET